MAKITIVGEAIVITSALKLEELKTIAKYRPNELKLKGGEDGKEVIFKIGITEDCGLINEYGASFGREVHDGTHLAAITMCAVNKKDEDVKAWVADQIGGALINLNKLEAKLPEVLAEIEAEKAEVLDNITIA